MGCQPYRPKALGVFICTDSHLIGEGCVNTSDYPSAAAQKGNGCFGRVPSHKVPDRRAADEATGADSDGAGMRASLIRR
jgi:hypothetical protein